MPGCAVTSCKNSSMNKIKASTVSFHVFPSDKKLIKQWIAKCRLGKNNNFNPVNSRVCSVHFTDADYIRDLRNELLGLPPRRKLKSDALPSKCLPIVNVDLHVQTSIEMQENEAVEKQVVKCFDENVMSRKPEWQKNNSFGKSSKLANVSTRSKCRTSQEIETPKSQQCISKMSDTSASGCPMAMKGKMRYEVVAADGRPLKAEPSLGPSPTTDTGAHSNGNFVPLSAPKSPNPLQAIKKCRLSTEESDKSGDTENDDDIRALEEEIIELQEYNAKVESEMIKLRTDITQMEQHIRMTERDNQSLAQKSHRMSEYYESLRNNFISLLDQVRLPNFDERPTHDNFDTYLNRLQSLCTDSCREENKAILSSVKQALQDFPIHLTSGWLRS